MQSGSLTLTGSVLLVALLVNAPAWSMKPLKRYKRRLRAWICWSESCGADRLCRSSMSYSVTGLTPRHQLFPREEPGVVLHLELFPLFTPLTFTLWGAWNCSLPTTSSLCKLLCIELPPSRHAQWNGLKVASLRVTLSELAGAEISRNGYPLRYRKPSCNSKATDT